MAESRGSLQCLYILKKAQETDREKERKKERVERKIRLVKEKVETSYQEEKIVFGREI